MKKFRLFSQFRPTGDQPTAIKRLVKNLKAGIRNQVLLGITGSGKTFSVAKVIEKIQKPVLILGGGKDLSCPARVQRKIARKIPGSSYKEFPELDHYGMIDGPRLPHVADRIVSFLNSLSKD